MLPTLLVRCTDWRDPILRQNNIGHLWFGNSTWILTIVLFNLIKFERKQIAFRCLNNLVIFDELLNCRKRADICWYGNFTLIKPEIGKKGNVPSPSVTIDVPQKQPNLQSIPLTLSSALQYSQIQKVTRWVSGSDLCRLSYWMFYMVSFTDYLGVDKAR